MKFRQNRFIVPIKGQKINKDLCVVLLAAGAGKHTRSHGPKSTFLLPNTEALINYQIDTIKKILPIANIIVVCGYQSEKVFRLLEKYSDLSILENENFDDTSSVRSMSIALRACPKDRYLFINGDLVFSPETLSIINENKSAIIYEHGANQNKEEIGITYHSEIEHLAYGLSPQWWPIIYINGKEDVAIFRKIVCNKLNHRRLDFEIINDAINKGLSFKAVCPHNMLVTEIDYYKDIEKVQC